MGVPPKKKEKVNPINMGSEKDVDSLLRNEGMSLERVRNQSSVQATLIADVRSPSLRKLK